MWYNKKIKKAREELDTDFEEGLTKNEASKRLKEHGKNKLKKGGKIEFLKILARQFESYLVAILIVAVLISLFLGRVVDTITITIILVLNALLGFIQEYRAEKAMLKLKEMSSPEAKVLRSGEVHKIEAEDLVPGDIILIEKGDKVPADARLIESQDLKIEEAALTGESVPVEKETGVLKGEIAVGDRKNMVFMSTIVRRGEGKAVVVRTGMKSEMGKIAEMVKETKEVETPLQRKLDKFGKKVGMIVVGLVLVIALTGFFADQEIYTILLTAVTLAVSAVPEGLPAVITFTLAMGMREMAKKNAIVKKLRAVEGLGSTTVICADKTGTMTKNEMTVQEIYLGEDLLEVKGVGYKPEGKIMKDKEEVKTEDSKRLDLLVKAGALCNDTTISKEEGEWEVIGDPTEAALSVLAKKAGYDPGELRSNYKEVRKIDFSAERKRMTTINKGEEGFFAFVKGAPEVILDRSTKILGADGELKKLDREKWSKRTEELASEGLRILALAYKNLDSKKGSEEEIETDLTLLGLVGIIDPPREGVRESIKTAKKAGVRTIMITGDHELTAKAIAQEVGLLEESKKVLTGQELNKLSQEELREEVRKVQVFSRVDPEHKVKILKALKANGEIVAMTGDGVNDAPALKNADIGVAMGIKGTDVSREAADMILSDDNFNTIVEAIQEGRGIYGNIEKFVKFLLSANFDELGIILMTNLTAMPLPLLPVQILWINLITDGFPALSLSFGPYEKGLMKEPPRDPEEGILEGFWAFMIASLIAAMLIEIPVYLYGLEHGVKLLRTMFFTIVVLFELFFVFNCRSNERGVFRKNPLGNKYLALSVIVSAILQVVAVHLPLFNRAFSTVPLGLNEWMMVFGFSSVGLLIVPEIFIRKGKEGLWEKFQNKIGIDTN